MISYQKDIFFLLGMFKIGYCIQYPEKDKALTEKVNAGKWTEIKMLC